MGCDDRGYCSACGGDYYGCNAGCPRAADSREEQKQKEASYEIEVQEATRYLCELVLTSSIPLKPDDVMEIVIERHPKVHRVDLHLLQLINPSNFEFNRTYVKGRWRWAANK